MKPILVQQRCNGTLWWVVDWKITVHTPLQWGWGKQMHRVYTLIPADEHNGRGTRIDLAGAYRFLSN